uniref:non-specific serine/threonine protein kinase n=1 Tax=Neobodo designis TaxID=312471 RepID=A0A7S1QFW0_NEODS|mmetsp:Transcript_41834/g.129269  ORF Transcript_41834/g.129269 Transcript_41834/m.129269 type:complete len:488 (+) Transcript_41834:115-1578(+)|eukprot:CAMPEP_0174850238 /NCGR_PEP_ID=MMETSP1114-20130205/19116_1 /TAXON_ID=312471 /ORGANISM="Neobodo designis, Strain CCAP 1951/1" /LENGTH=487 /DNA_ID=CAMNT_0016084677 /DNA_START=112 /DNA_END=1575 /DNA_ORIENTATION=-
MERYTKVRNIGKGNMGACTLARNNEDGRHYVIKQVDLGKLNKKERQQSLNEAKLLSSLRHPNVINYVDSFLARKSDHLCIVMEFADGGDLSNKVKNAHGVHFSQEQVLDWAIQIALALQHITAKRILHRDVKTQNVFLTSDGLCKLGDFGIARTLASTFDQAHTFVGTPYYLSPELILERPYDAMSDTWAFGVCLYEMMALKHPFNANDMKSLMQRILKVQYDPPPTTYSPELRNIVTRLLTKDPAQRMKLSEMLEAPILVNRMKQWLQGGILPSRYISSLVRHKLLPPVVMASVQPANPATDSSQLPTIGNSRRRQQQQQQPEPMPSERRGAPASNSPVPSHQQHQQPAPAQQRVHHLGGNPMRRADGDVRTEFRDVRLKPKPPPGVAPMPSRDPTLLNPHAGGGVHQAPQMMPQHSGQPQAVQRPARGALPALGGDRRGSDAPSRMPPRLAGVPQQSRAMPEPMPRRLPAVGQLPQAGQAPQHRW